MVRNIYPMTDPKPCAEINASLALAKGWQHSGFGWLDPKTYDWQENPPDFCGDSKYTGGLLEEIIGSGMKSHRVELYENTACAEPEIVCSFTTRNDEIMEAGATLPEAVARAAEAMLEGKRIPQHEEKNEKANTPDAASA